MKPQEFQIGNLMYLESEEGKITRGKIQKIDDDFAYIYGIGYPLSRFRPVDLYEKDVTNVLGIGSVARFGALNWFIGRTDSAEFYLVFKDHHFFIGNALRVNINFEEQIYFNVIKRIQHVHELQNFLRFIGTERVVEQFK